MHWLVIDDERTFVVNRMQATIGPSGPEQPEVLNYARTSDEGLLAIAKHCIEYTQRYGPELVLYLDHDLGGSDTILPVVNFLLSVKVPGIAWIKIHSQNPVSKDLVKPLKHAGYICQKVSLPALEK